MKIAVATDDNQTVTGHIGRCNAFIFYTIEDGKIVNREIKENNHTHHKMHGHDHTGEEHSHGHSHSGLINLLDGCSALIFSYGGWRLIEDLKQNKINPVMTDVSLADEAALLYSTGKLVNKEENTCNHH